MIKAFIIDDIEQARITLKKDLEDYAPDVEVIGEADGVVQAAKMLKTLKPDVIFLDIQMQDGSGFDLLDILPEIPFKIIFITASDAHAIKAFRYAAIDYLLKPVDPDELKVSIAKLKEQYFNESDKYNLLSESLKNPANRHKRIALHAVDKIQIMDVEEILRFESKNNYTIITFRNNQPMLVSRTLGEFEEMLSDQGFIRVHHSFLVNVSYVREFKKSDGGFCVMSDGFEVPVSVRKKQEVLKILENL